MAVSTKPSNTLFRHSRHRLQCIREDPSYVIVLLLERDWSGLRDIRVVVSLLSTLRPARSMLSSYHIMMSYYLSIFALHLLHCVWSRQDTGCHDIHASKGLNPRTSRFVALHTYVNQLVPHWARNTSRTKSCSWAHLMLAVVGILLFAPSFLAVGRKVGKLNDIRKRGAQPNYSKTDSSQSWRYRV